MTTETDAATMSTKRFWVLAVALVLPCLVASGFLIAEGPEFRRNNPNPWVPPAASHKRVMLVSEDATPITRAYLFDVKDKLQKDETMECTKQGWFADLPSFWEEAVVLLDADKKLDADIKRDANDRISLGTFPLTNERLQVIIVPKDSLPPSFFASREPDLPESLLASRDPG